MKKSLLLLSVLSTLSFSAFSEPTPANPAANTKHAHAATVTSSSEAALVASFKAKYPATSVKSIRKSPIDGMYEVEMGNQIAYTDASMTYLIFGHVFEMATQSDLTQMRLDEINKVDFSALPVGKAIKVVKGDGKRKFAVFTDPDCPYCKQLETSLKGVTNFTMYVYLFPIAGLHPEAESHANAIWCAKDKAAAWEDFMLNGKLPESKECATPVKEIAEIGQGLGVQGTPTIIRADGARAPGALPTQQLNDWLDGKKIQLGR